MNKIIDQSESDFRRSIAKMSIEEHESLLRLINRELSLTQQELKRTYELLEISKQKHNNLEVYRYEQNIRDVELEVEKLDRKRAICQTQNPNQASIQNKIATKNQNGNAPINVVKQTMVTNGPPVFVPTSSRLSPIQSENDDIVLSTKRLINDFERLSNTDSVGSSTSSVNNKGTVNPRSKPTLSDSYSTSSLPANRKSQIQVQSSQSCEPIFTTIKLRKVGLPPDAKELDQSTFLNVGSQRGSSNDKIIQSPPVILSNNSPRLSSIDFGRNNDKNSKDKFHNPNKEIQVAIQNEIKEIKLKKTSLNSPPLNCSVEQVNMGKFNFSNEKSFSSCSSMSTSMSASKSMPFLNSIASMPITLEDPVSTPSPQLIENNFSDQESYLKNWDPAVVLKKLYMIQRKSNIITSNKSTISPFASYIDVVHGSLIGRPCQKEYIVITNGQLSFYKNDTNKSATETMDLRFVNTKLSHNDSLELYDSKGLQCTLRCLKPSDYQQLISTLEYEASRRIGEIIPHLYEDITECNSQKVLIVDLGSCSVRAGLLKVEPTLPGLYFPNIAAISKSSNDVIEVGFEALNPTLLTDCDIIRPLKPDTTLEHVAFTSGSVEATMTKICSKLGIDPRHYIVMLSLPYNVSESSRSKLADVLLLRLNFKGVSMCGESLLALHAYGEPTGVLVDIGCRTEILPVTHGVVQTAAVQRSLFGGHLMQVALSHLLPFELHSITDSLLVRLIMEEVCCVATNNEEAHNYCQNAFIDLRQYNLPANIQSSLILQGKDRCLPTEGLFNPEIYSIDTCGLAKIIMQSIQSCPIDFRKNLYQSIYLSGSATQVPGLLERLRSELKDIIPGNCAVKVYAAPDRAHFSYVGACFVASQESFLSTVVDRRGWEDSRILSLKKWHF